MSKSLDKLGKLVTPSGSPKGQVSGGFGSLKGGASSADYVQQPNSGCTNSVSCANTNVPNCTNSGFCDQSSNKSCSNTGFCGL